MSKVIKGMVTEELRSRYDGVSSACVVDITGLNVQEQQELRTNLREKNARMQIEYTKPGNRNGGIPQNAPIANRNDQIGLTVGQYLQACR